MLSNAHSVIESRVPVLFMSFRLPGRVPALQFPDPLCWKGSGSKVFFVGTFIESSDRRFFLLMTCRSEPLALGLCFSPSRMITISPWEAASSESSSESPPPALGSLAREGLERATLLLDKCLFSKLLRLVLEGVGTSPGKALALRMLNWSRVIIAGRRAVSVLRLANRSAIGELKGRQRQSG